MNRILVEIYNIAYRKLYDEAVLICGYFPILIIFSSTTGFSKDLSSELDEAVLIVAIDCVY